MRFHDELYRQNLTGEVRNWTTDGLTDTAAYLGLNGVELENCLNENRHRHEILIQKGQGQSAGVRGTPTLFLDGRKLAYRDYYHLSDQIRQRIEERETSR